MTELYNSDGIQLFNGDCREVLATLPDHSVDAVVSDPPYGLSFMGKRWDYDVPSVEVWQQCLRVLKPGGHLLAFAGTRTQHRMACRIEDAGFEIRDMIAWVYGSGFPKSLDVSKAIDKAAGVEREVVGTRPLTGKARILSGADYNGNYSDEYRGSDKDYKESYSVTAPATEAAKQWQGWGTALKPSIEPVTWARKPLNVVPSDVMLQASNLLGALVCQSLANAKNVERLLLSSQNGSAQDARPVSARLIAGVLHGRRCGELSDVMGMFKSQEAAKTIWSIVESWSFIWDAVYSQQNTFTTSTAIGLTTALKILSCSILPIMADFIAGHEFHPLGWFLSADTAEPSSTDSSARQANAIFARDVVTLPVVQKLANCAEQNFTNVARIASSVLQNAITCLEGSIRPNLDPCVMARKPLEGTVAANVLQYGTGALNVDGCRVGDEVWVRKATGNSTPYGSPITWNTSDTLDIDRSGTGRWPANFIHDGSREATGILGEESRFFYCPKTSQSERGKGNNHPTVKPIDLMRYLCRMVTPPGGVVLDPFAGSGSTLLAARREGFRAIGIELSEEYCGIIRSRLGEPEEAASEVLEGQRTLF